MTPRESCDFFFLISLCFEEKTIILIYEDFIYSMPITYIKKETPLLYFLPGSLILKLYFGPQLSLGFFPDSKSRAMLFSCLIIPGECCQRKQARSLQSGCSMLILSQFISPLLPSSHPWDCLNTAVKKQNSKSSLNFPTPNKLFMWNT